MGYWVYATKILYMYYILNVLTCKNANPNQDFISQYNIHRTFTTAMKILISAWYSFLWYYYLNLLENTFKLFYLIWTIILVVYIKRGTNVVFSHISSDPFTYIEVLSLLFVLLANNNKNKDHPPFLRPSINLHISKTHDKYGVLGNYMYMGSRDSPSRTCTFIRRIVENIIKLTCKMITNDGFTPKACVRFQCDLTGIKFLFLFMIF